MPTELLRVASGMRWERTTIRRGEAGLETELLFGIDGRPFAVTIDSMPRGDFLLGVLDACSLVIYEVSSEERGWVEPGRYQIRLGEDDDLGVVTALADHVHWGPVSPA